MTDEMLNHALRLSLEFGPNWLKPVDGRLREKYPELTPGKAREADAICKKIRDFANGGIAMVFHGRQQESVVRAAIMEKWPWIDAENLSHMWSQGMYYAMKD